MAATKSTNIIRKVEITEGDSHHGGAWKVAYADFMTAMMAFFLLLWILSSSDEQKLRGIAEYFTNATMPNGSGLLDGATFGPPGTLNASTGTVVARGAEMGEIDDPSPARWEVMDMTQAADPDDLIKGTYKGAFDNPATGAISEQEPAPATMSNREGQAEGDHAYQAAGAPANDPAAAAQAQAEAEALQEGDTASFDALQQELTQAIQANPDLRPLVQNVIFERTPEGMRIQVVDQDGKAMFASGSANLAPATRTLMQTLGQSLAKLPNEMVISGHTDAVPFSNARNYDNWDLSSDRANAMRRVLLGAGVSPDRITRVSGMADTELLVPEDPRAPSNRRISVLLEYRKPAQPLPAAAAPAAGEPGAALAPHQTAPAQPATAGPVKSRRAEAPIAPLPQRVSELDETVFENLRSALR
ncbi:flagellar motor protein MotB [Pseudodonghicola flavimaris]|uniref:Flagellar motor protein MotB n=1 Tax=Pseudodonghicola flavimaris TaxID=3050036 RepID=A0ABT7EWL5_9RHOB|nr:flagellar motor protein MotB [Pseudodonghicola flavimaris]MDK3016735.1 flagellar motor protein MotB [Pseudodonghicola flavimaris]